MLDPRKNIQSQTPNFSPQLQPSFLVARIHIAHSNMHFAALARIQLHIAICIFFLGVGTSTTLRGCFIETKKSAWEHFSSHLGRKVLRCDATGGPGFKSQKMYPFFVLANFAILAISTYIKPNIGCPLLHRKMHTAHCNIAI